MGVGGAACKNDGTARESRGVPCWSEQVCLSDSGCTGGELLGSMDGTVSNGGWGCE